MVELEPRGTDKSHTVYRVTHHLKALVRLTNLWCTGVPPAGRLRTSVGTYCPSGKVKHPKIKSTQPRYQGDGSPCISIFLLSIYPSRHSLTLLNTFAVLRRIRRWRRRVRRLPDEPAAAPRRLLLRPTPRLLRRRDRHLRIRHQESGDESGLCILLH